MLTKSLQIVSACGEGNLASSPKIDYPAKKNSEWYENGIAV
jgi:hypothetical protein